MDAEGTLSHGRTCRKGKVLDIAGLRHTVDFGALRADLDAFIRDLYPVCRSITGAGVRETLRRIALRIPLDVREIPTGTSVLDWTIPPEWNVRDAYIANSGGQRVVDFRDSNLHLVSYSIPIDRTVPRAELDAHLHSLPEQPDLIPYRTSYYTKSWGFCVSERQRQTLTDETYHVVIDASLEDGSLTYAESVIPGRVADEILLTTHVCHPSLANDNLTGIAVLTALGELLHQATPRYTYRLLFNPVTIGSIAWLAENGDAVARVRHGLVVAGCGDPGPITYKRSRGGEATIDRGVTHVLSTRAEPHVVEDFSPYGYDERQYCSPGFDLPVGALGRTPNGRYPEYHTSADTPDFVQPQQVVDFLDVLLEALEVLEGDECLDNLYPYGEPQLGRRGLYKAMGGHAETQGLQLALLWTLNLSDGQHSLLDIARRSGLRFGLVREAADVLLDAGVCARRGRQSP